MMNSYFFNHSITNLKAVESKIFNLALYLGILLAFSVSSKSHAQFSIVPTTNDPRILQDLNPYIQNVVSKLPPLMVDTFNKKNIRIKLQFKTLNNGSQLGDARSSDLIVLDTSVLTTLIEKKELQLNVRDWSFFKKLKNIDKKNYDFPKHKNVESFLEGLLIHELSHKFDMLGLPYMKYLKISLDCIFGVKNQNSRTCQKIRMTEDHSLSYVKEFLNLAYWPDRGFIEGEPRSINQLYSRSPNPYESTNPEESFAVNMEFYLLDPEYKCRRPNLYKFFSDYFNNFEPFKNIECETIKPVLILDKKKLNNKQSQAHPLNLIELDFNKLYQIHYLFGTENEDNSSESFGHSMIRLIFCNPNRDKISEDCLKDVNYHYVANFKGAVNELSVDIIKGLFGGYQSLLFIEPFSQIQHRYTGLSFRNLESIPIEFSKNEIKNRDSLKKVFDAIIETHWSYVGDYRFLSNNCAQETFSIIKSGITDETYFDFYTSLPTTLRDLFIKTEKNQLIFKKSEDLSKDGYYYFPSRESKYLQSFNKLKELNLIPSSIKHFEEYVKSKANDRFYNLSQLMQNLDSSKNKDLKLSLVLANFYKLEELIEFKFSTFAIQLPLSRMDESEIQNNVIKKYFEEYSKQIIPAVGLQMNQTYGIPTLDETKISFNKYLNENNEKDFKEAAQKLNDYTKELITKSDYDELTQIHKNLDFILKEIRRAQD